jgi:hypothetical protein
VESLLWHRPDGSDQAEFQKVFGKEQLSQLMPDWGLTTDRELIFNRARISQGKLHNLIVQDEFRKAASIAKLVLDKDRPEAFFLRNGLPALEIHSMRPARRIGPEGHTRTELVVEMTQRRRGYYDAERQKEVDKGSGEIPKADFIFRGGCTLLINPESGEVRYCIYKRILSQNRLERMRKFLTGGEDPSLAANYFGNPYKTYFKDFATHRDDSQVDRRGEPFRILHHAFESEEEFDV